MIYTFYKTVWKDVAEVNEKIYFKTFFLTFNLTSTLVAILVTLKNQKEISDALNKLSQMWSELLRNKAELFDGKLLKTFMLKFLLIDVSGVVFVFSLRYIYTTGRLKSQRIQSALFTTIQFVTSLNIHNMFIILLYVATHIYRLINTNFRNLNQNIKRLESGSTFWNLSPAERFTIIRVLEARLDQLVDWHFLLNELTQKLIEMHGFTIFLITMCDFFTITSSLFSLYVAVLLEHRGLAHFSLYAFHVFSVGFTTLQTFSLVRASAHFTKRAQKTGLILEDRRHDCPEDRLSQIVS